MELKLRFWDNRINKMIYSYNKSWGEIGDCYLSDPHFDNFTMIWTGLIDKNGKDIYYGDIVSKYHDDISEDRDFREVEQIKGHPEIGCFSYYEASEDFTIIGNVYQNTFPMLSKGE